METETAAKYSLNQRVRLCDDTATMLGESIGHRTGTVIDAYFDVTDAWDDELEWFVPTWWYDVKWDLGETTDVIEEILLPI
jgi:hypothetical protein